MNEPSHSAGRRLAVVLAIAAIVIGIAAVIFGFVRGKEFNPRPLGAVVIGLIVIASVRGRSNAP